MRLSLLRFLALFLPSNFARFGMVGMKEEVTNNAEHKFYYEIIMCVLESEYIKKAVV
jgi:hypothetical protein